MDQTGARATDGAASARGWEAPPGIKSAASSAHPAAPLLPNAAATGASSSRSLLHQHRRLRELTGKPRAPPPPTPRHSPESGRRPPRTSGTAPLHHQRLPAPPVERSLDRGSQSRPRRQAALAWSVAAALGSPGRQRRPPQARGARQAGGEEE